MNKDEKMIEEMASIICKETSNKGLCEKCDFKKHEQFGYTYQCHKFDSAEALYNANCRIIADDEFILKQDEMYEFRKDQAEVKFLKDKIEREAVEKFAKIVISVIFEDEENEKIKIRDVHDTIRDILRMHYDLELED